MVLGSVARSSVQYFIYYFYFICLSVWPTYNVSAPLLCNACGGQERVSDPLEPDSLLAACGCLELNPGPLREHLVFLTTEPSLQLLCS